MNLHFPSCCGEIFKFVILRNKLKQERNIKTFICRTKWSLTGTSNKQNKSLFLGTPRVILINMSGKLGIDMW